MVFCEEPDCIEHSGVFTVSSLVLVRPRLLEVAKVLHVTEVKAFDCLSKCLPYALELGHCVGRCLETQEEQVPSDLLNLAFEQPIVVFNSDHAVVYPA